MNSSIKPIIGYTLNEFEKSTKIYEYPFQELNDIVKKFSYSCYNRNFQQNFDLCIKSFLHKTGYQTYIQI